MKVCLFDYVVRTDVPVVSTVYDLNPGPPSLLPFTPTVFICLPFLSHVGPLSWFLVYQIETLPAVY